MNTDDILQRLSEQTVGIIITQVTLIREGDFMEILHTVDIGGLKTLGIHSIAEAFDSVVHTGNLSNKSFGLKLLQLFARHTFNFGIADRHTGDSFRIWI